MADYIHGEIDKRIERLEKRLAREYRQALKELEIKADSYFKEYKKQDRVMRLKLIHGEITKKDYRAWRERHIMYTKRYNAMIDDLADDLTKTNLIASNIINNTLPSTFADASNFSSFMIEKAVNKASINFAIYNKDAVLNLLAKGTIKLPKASPDIPKDMLWNKQKINSALAQGIMQGESLTKIAKRLRAVTDMDRNASLRNARTLHTAAESLGRIDSMKRAEDLGIDTYKQWIATHDNRTRDPHRELDGQIRAIDKPFENSLGKIRFAGDTTAAPSNFYNCRCSVIPYMPKYPYKASNFTGEEYEAWKRGKRAYNAYLGG